MVGPFGVRSRAPMDPTLIAELGTVAAYEIKTSNVTLYLVECSRCGRRLDYHSRLLAVEVLRRHAAFCERPTSR
jgi:hypothetical protein